MRDTSILLCGIVLIGVAAAAQQMQSRPQVARTDAVQVRPLPPEMSRRYTGLRTRLQPSASSWVQQQARAEAQQPVPNLPVLESAIRSRFGGTALSGNDIDSLAFIVLMQATDDMDQDLQQMMAEMKSITASKQQLRDLISEVNKDARSGARPTAPCSTSTCRSLAARISQIETAAPKSPKLVRLQVPANPTFGELRQVQDKLNANLDSMNDLSEATSLRLQMTMDRRSKFLETMSNIMKKISTTSDTVVQNLK